MNAQPLHTSSDNGPEKETYAELPQEQDGQEKRSSTREERSVGLLAQVPEEKGAFVDSLRARTFVGTVIVLDLLCLGIEADHPSAYWGWIEVTLVLFYMCEMALRLKSDGWQMFLPSELVLGKRYKTHWHVVALNFFRLFLVVAGLVDCYIWVMGFSAWRAFFMYLRLLRVVRIFHLFDVLTRFVVALLSMTKNLSWIFCVIALVSYVSAVFFTLYAKDHHLEDVQVFFPDVWSSAFSLFQVTTMDNWHAIAVPLVRYHGAWGVFFVVFIAFTSWTMISLLTAVVSEQIILATRDMKVRETEMLEMRHKDFVLFLKKCFLHADSDGNGVLDKQEFTSLIQEEIVTRKMEDLGVIIQHEELQNTFDMLDVDESGELTIDEFTVGLSQLQQSLGIKHVLSINYAIQRIHRKLHKQLAAHSTGTMDKFEELNTKIDELGTKIVTREDLDVKMDRVERKLAQLTEIIRTSSGAPRPLRASISKIFEDRHDGREGKEPHS